MSSHILEKLERIQQALTNLREESAEGILIVVEGKKDAQALRDLGVSGPIVTVKTGGKSFAQSLSEIELTGASQVILLLDFDRRGRQGIRKFREAFEHGGVKTNMIFWRTLSALAGKELQCIEGLTAYLRTLEEKAK